MQEYIVEIRILMDGKVEKEKVIDALEDEIYYGIEIGKPFYRIMNIDVKEGKYYDMDENMFVLYMELKNYLGDNVRIVKIDGRRIEFEVEIKNAWDLIPFMGDYYKLIEYDGEKRLIYEVKEVGDEK